MCIVQPFSLVLGICEGVPIQSNASYAEAWKKLYACFRNWLNCPVESGYACGCSKPIFRLFWFPHKLLYLHCLLCSRLVSCRANAQVLNSTCIFPCWNVSALLDNDNDNGNWNMAFSGIKMTPSRVWALKLSLSKEKKKYSVTKKPLIITYFNKSGN